MSEYGKPNPNIKIDYQSIGSGGGIKQIQAADSDFGASDAPMTDEDLKAFAGDSGPCADRAGSGRDHLQSTE